MKWICYILLFLSVPLVYADEMALFDRDQVKKYVNAVNSEESEDEDISEHALINSEVQHIEPAIDIEEESYLNQEQQKIREIKLLSLDVEKKGLEYKHQLINTRISKLNGTKKKEQPISENPADRSITVSAIIISKEHKYGFIQINGVRYKVVEKQVIDDIAVVAIDLDKIKFQYKNGNIEIISINPA